MRITVAHSTRYHYDLPVILEPHIFRLRPRMTNTQRLLAFDLQIVPTPAGTAECLDQDGNLVLNAWAEVYLPGIGLARVRSGSRSRGFHGHVALATGFDYDRASPVAGWYSGGSRSQMEAALSLQVDDAG